MLVRCTNCVIPTTRPNTIFKDGVCQACINYKERLKVNWNVRYKELEELCNKYRRNDGRYDCIIPVSGGKDSHTQVYYFKEKLHMNPLLVCVADPFTHTEAGTHNLKNLNRAFNCDLITYTMSLDLFKRVTKLDFEKLHDPFRLLESMIYTVPYKFAMDMDIPLVVFGENAAYLYGTSEVDSYDATKYVVSGDSAAGKGYGKTLIEHWLNNGISINELNCINLSSTKVVYPMVIFLSYFIPWDDDNNVALAKRYGFKDLHHEWHREGVIEEYAQVDSLGYMVHIWTKYPKFQFSRTSDIVSRWIRKGKITRDEAMKLVEENDYKLDQRAIDDFCAFMGYTQRQFWDVIEGYWNTDLFEKVDGIWRQKK